MERIIAVFQPLYRASHNQEVYPAGDAQKIDVTWRVLQLPLEDIVNISDNDEVSKELINGLHDNCAIFSVQVKQSIADYFGIDDLNKLTQTMLNDKKDMVTKPPLTNTEYSQIRDDICPYCGNDVIDTDLIGSADPHSRNTCDMCGAEWTDDYDLTGFVPADGSGPYQPEVDTKKIVALFQPQYHSSQNQEVYPAGDHQTFDVTWRVLHMPIKELREITDNSEGSKKLIADMHGHCGPFSMQVKQSIADFFGVEDLRTVTQSMRNKWKPLIKKPPMTDYEYIVSDGFTCPYCGSSNIEEGEAEYLGKEASSFRSCEDCMAEWINTYHVVGYNAEVVGHPVVSEETDD